MISQHVLEGVRRESLLFIRDEIVLVEKVQSCQTFRESMETKKTKAHYLLNETRFPACVGREL